MRGVKAFLMTQMRKRATDCSLLPLVHDIIKCMDKDSQDVHQELTKVKAKIQEAREQISNMGPIDSSRRSTAQQLATLREQSAPRNQLLQKYKSMCMFDVPKHRESEDWITAPTGGAHGESRV
ncbi:mediator of RNA polymerase II transcription subunit 9-like [Larimichthys crocea]|uniref:mediator of RNA polymerase II transcription subunit 9-like n=1 Tax=Larimichthys crocea TaxID=215358 RepID=UPI000F5F7DAA|nr:mediator of RNA polymerase II transcription subunit 9-like [Larimichthys crocea]